AAPSEGVHTLTTENLPAADRKGGKALLASSDPVAGSVSELLLGVLPAETTTLGRSYPHPCLCFSFVSPSTNQAQGAVLPDPSPAPAGLPLHLSLRHRVQPL